MDENNEVNWNTLIPFLSDAGLQWYATVTQRPIATNQSMLRYVTGSDLSGPRGTTYGPTASGVIIVALAAIIGAVIIFR